MGFFDQVILDARPRARRDASPGVDSTDGTSELVWPTSVADRESSRTLADAASPSVGARMPAQSNAPQSPPDRVRVQRKSASTASAGTAGPALTHSGTISAGSKLESTPRRDDSAPENPVATQETLAAADPIAAPIGAPESTPSSASDSAPQPAVPAEKGTGVAKTTVTSAGVETAVPDAGVTIEAAEKASAPMIVQRATTESSRALTPTPDPMSVDTSVAGAPIPDSVAPVDASRPSAPIPQYRVSNRERLILQTADAEAPNASVEGTSSPDTPETRESPLAPEPIAEGPRVDAELAAEPPPTFAITSAAFPSPADAFSGHQAPAPAESPAVVIGQVDVIVTAETPRREEPAASPAEAPADLSRLYLRRL